MRCAIIAVALFLAGCAATPAPPVIVTKTVNVEVPIHCTPNIGPEPIYDDADAVVIAAPDFGSRLKLILSGRVQRIQRLGELLTALKGCE